MTFREKLEKEHPDVNIEMAIAGNCPCDYGYERYTPRCPMDMEHSCFDCWEREIPGSDIEDGVTEEMKHQIIEKSIVTQKPDGNIEFKVEQKTMLGTEDMHINTETFPIAKILDSGNRRQFASGAVRDIQEGKGRMDLLPWGAIIEVSKHCENGAKKYGEHNVDKGIPTHSLCDSAARHLAKYLDGWTDEPHLLAAAWNLLWALQMELKHKECVDTPWTKKEDDTTSTQQE